MKSDVVLGKVDGSFALELGYDTLHLRSGVKGFVDGVSDAVNRKAVENRKVKVLMNPHQSSGKDHLHYRRCGLNQVLCMLAAKNSVAIGISFDKMQSSLELGKVSQIIRLCKKYGVSLYVFSFAENNYGLFHVNDVLALLRSLGMDAGLAKKALEFDNK